ncbi:MAG: Loki-CTERM sorting domain-containing protein [Promethearchaeota archaeon]
MPDNWVLCVGSWAFIMAGVDEDYTLLDTSGRQINTSVGVQGITKVTAVVSNISVFNYEFAQKPTYTIYELGNPANHSVHDVDYQTVDIVDNDDFINLVSGMTELIGPFGQLLTSYVINQTNHFVNGITFDDVWDHFDPESTAALFVTCYPEYGEYHGGRLEHDPTFSALFTPGDSWNINPKTAIPGFPTFLVLIFAFLGVTALVITKKRFEH